MAGVVAGAWLINGADRNPGASLYYTNRIRFDGCQFNGATGYTGVIDDGGIAHTFQDCNWNAGTTYIRATATYALNLLGGEFEHCDSIGIVFQITQWSGAVGARNESPKISGCYLFNSNVIETVFFAAGSMSTLTFTANTLFTAAGPVFSGTSNAVDIVAQGNTQLGAGAGYTSINNYFTAQATTTTWAGAGSNPAIGNGSLSAVYSRKGREITFTVSLGIGSTTTLGTGNWTFSLPAALTSLNCMGSAFMVCAGALEIGIARATSTSPTNAVTVFCQDTAFAVQSTVPGAWANGNTLEFTVTYATSTLLG
jgi:hypothetical protein